MLNRCNECNWAIEKEYSDGTKFYDCAVKNDILTSSNVKVLGEVWCDGCRHFTPKMKLEILKFDDYGRL